MCGDPCAHRAINDCLQYVCVGVQFGFWEEFASLSWLLTDLCSTCALLRGYAHRTYSSENRAHDTGCSLSENNYI